MKNLPVRACRALAATWAALVWAAAGAAVSTPVGIIVGAAVAALWALGHAELSAFLPMFVYFTLCAAAAGVILGAFIRLFDGHNPLFSSKEQTVALTQPRKRLRGVPASLLARLHLPPPWPRQHGDQPDPWLN